MEVVGGISYLRSGLDRRRADGESIGFVPTMGALHDGHLSLVRAALDARCSTVLVSIFVNPLQFAANEDLASYPRDLDRDVALAKSAGATLVFAPSVEQMYPDWPLRTSVSVAEITDTMEGAARPGHFDGVATVVNKLFNISGPCRAFFGEKDYQQLAVIRQMVRDLSLPVNVVGCPTVREPDGLALSSRNVYLAQAERSAAPILQRALRSAVDAIDAGERSAAAVREMMRAMIEPIAPLDYAEVVDATTLQRVDPLAGELRLLVAARFGKARLIDNVGARV
jgi:pantoate--beta-alanine ligase